MSLNPRTLELNYEAGVAGDLGDIRRRLEMLERGASGGASSSGGTVIVNPPDPGQYTRLGIGGPAHGTVELTLKGTQPRTLLRDSTSTDRWQYGMDTATAYYLDYIGFSPTRRHIEALSTGQTKLSQKLNLWNIPSTTFGAGVDPYGGARGLGSNTTLDMGGPLSSGPTGNEHLNTPYNIGIGRQTMGLSVASTQGTTGARNPADGQLTSIGQAVTGVGTLFTHQAPVGSTIVAVTEVGPNLTTTTASYTIPNGTTYGQTVPNVPVASTAGFNPVYIPINGYLRLIDGATTRVVRYTSIDATNFKGCTLADGTTTATTFPSASKVRQDGVPTYHFGTVTGVTNDVSLTLSSPGFSQGDCDIPTRFSVIVPGDPWSGPDTMLVDDAQGGWPDSPGGQSAFGTFWLGKSVSVSLQGRGSMNVYSASGVITADHGGYAELGAFVSNIRSARSGALIGNEFAVHVDAGKPSRTHPVAALINDQNDYVDYYAPALLGNSRYFTTGARALWAGNISSAEAGTGVLVNDDAGGRWRRAFALAHGGSLSIASLTVSGTTVTVTTTADHYMTVGERFSIPPYKMRATLATDFKAKVASSVTNPFWFVASIPSSTSFTYTIPTAPTGGSYIGGSYVKRDKDKFIIDGHGNLGWAPLDHWNNYSGLNNWSNPTDQPRFPGKLTFGGAYAGDFDIYDIDKARRPIKIYGATSLTDNSKTKGSVELQAPLHLMAGDDGYQSVRGDFSFNVTGVDIVSVTNSGSHALITTATPHPWLTGHQINIEGTGVAILDDDDWFVEKISDTTFKVKPTSSGALQNYTTPSTNAGAVKYHTKNKIYLLSDGSLTESVNAGRTALGGDQNAITNDTANADGSFMNVLQFSMVGNRSWLGRGSVAQYGGNINVQEAAVGGSVASATGSGGVVTITTTRVHGIHTGNRVTIVGCSLGGANVSYNLITVTGAKTFTLDGTAVSGSGSGGAIIAHDQYTEVSPSADSVTNARRGAYVTSNESSVNNLARAGNMGGPARVTGRTFIVSEGNSYASYGAAAGTAFPASGSDWPTTAARGIWVAATGSYGPHPVGTGIYLSGVGVASSTQDDFVRAIALRNGYLNKEVFVVDGRGRLGLGGPTKDQSGNSIISQLTLPNPPSLLSTTISTISNVGTDVIVVTAAAHNLRIGDKVTIASVAGISNVNGTWTVMSVPTTTAFHVTVTTAPTGTYTAASGTLVSTDHAYLTTELGAALGTDDLAAIYRSNNVLGNVAFRAAGLGIGVTAPKRALTTQEAKGFWLGDGLFQIGRSTTASQTWIGVHRQNAILPSGIIQGDFEHRWSPFFGGTITNITNSGTTVTLTTSASTGAVVGDRVTVSNVSGILNVNGTWTITAVSGSSPWTMTFTVTTTPTGTYEAATGNIAPAPDATSINSTATAVNLKRAPSTSTGGPALRTDHSFRVGGALTLDPYSGSATNFAIPPTASYVRADTDNQGSGFAVTLPALSAVAPGHLLHIVNVGSVNRTVTIAAVGSDVYEGPASLVNKDESTTLIADTTSLRWRKFGT